MKYFIILIITLFSYLIPNKYYIELSNIDIYELTVYHAVSSQTDDSPTITASNYKIKDIYNPKKICAVPQNMISEGLVSFGDYIYITCKDNRLSGHWRVEDVMNKRYNYCNKIDLLVSPTIYTKESAFVHI